MRRTLGLAVVAGGVVLAIIVGQRMSTDAMAVVLGVVFGVAASIPTSLLIVAATRGRRDEVRSYEPRYQAPQGHEPRPQPPPQIYIVNPGQQPAGAPWLQPGIQAQLPMPPGGYYTPQPQRRYHVVGEDEHWLDEDS
jgi:hypothetical protein